MSRKYHADFMTEEDHEIIFQHYARSPMSVEITGRWTFKLVADNQFTQVVQPFTLTRGIVEKSYVLEGLLRQNIAGNLTPEQMNMYDFNNWYDEVKIVKNDFIIGKWCSPWTQIPLTFGPSFLSVDVEKSSQKSRFCLRFIMKFT
jgi:hypothetical protein